jgi:hypothetical protein
MRRPASGSLRIVKVARSISAAAACTGSAARAIPLCALHVRAKSKLTRRMNLTMGSDTTMLFVLRQCAGKLRLQ